MWILADVFEKDARYIRPGQRARVTLSAGGAALSAKVSDILPQFDPSSRTYKVRLEMDNPRMDNPGYALRPDMFVDVQLAITLPASVSVPVDAVLDSGLRKTVFVDRGEGNFEPRVVETGWRFDERVQIVSASRPASASSLRQTFYWIPKPGYGRRPPPGLQEVTRHETSPIPR